MKGLNTLVAAAAVLATPNLGHGQTPEHRPNFLQKGPVISHLDKGELAASQRERTKIQRLTGRRVGGALAQPAIGTYVQTSMPDRVPTLLPTPAPEQADVNTSAVRTKKGPSESHPRATTVDTVTPTQPQDGHSVAHLTQKRFDHSANANFRPGQNVFPASGKQAHGPKFKAYEPVGTKKTFIADVKHDGSIEEFDASGDPKSIVRWTKRATSRVESKNRHQQFNREKRVAREQEREALLSEDETLEHSYDWGYLDETPESATSEKYLDYVDKLKV
jgi:hypothetical protein